MPVYKVSQEIFHENQHYLPGREVEFPADAVPPHHFHLLDGRGNPVPIGEDPRLTKYDLAQLKGLAIESLYFKNVSSEPLLGTLPHGYYDDISLGADFFSGHSIIEKPGEHKITDLKNARQTKRDGK